MKTKLLVLLFFVLIPWTTHAQDKPVTCTITESLQDGTVIIQCDDGTTWRGLTKDHLVVVAREQEHCSKLEEISKLQQQQINDLQETVRVLTELSNHQQHLLNELQAKLKTGKLDRFLTHPLTRIIAILAPIVAATSK